MMLLGMDVERKEEEKVDAGAGDAACRDGFRVFSAVPAARAP